MTKVEWTDETWNPVTGCTPVSPGCGRCYAKRMARRLAGKYGYPAYPDHFTVTLHPDRLFQPLGWKSPKRVFVNSMSDTFHKEVLSLYIREMFNVMAKADWHQFQVLTKRSRDLRSFSHFLNMAPNIWLGVSVENADYKYRIDDLRDANASTKFVSFEPLLDAIPDVDLTDIDWAIVGCESGPGARPMTEDWVRSIRDQCIEQDVAFFYKQRMENGKKVSCPELDGVVWDQYPDLEKGLCLASKANLSRIIAQPSLF